MLVENKEDDGCTLPVTNDVDSEYGGHGHDATDLLLLVTYQNLLIGMKNDDPAVPVLLAGESIHPTRHESVGTLERHALWAHRVTVVWDAAGKVGRRLLVQVSGGLEDENRVSTAKCSGTTTST